MIRGPVGAWSIPLRTAPLEDAVALARRMTAAGLGTLWVPGGRDDSLLDRVRDLLVRTEARVATGVLVTWRHPARAVADWLGSLPHEARSRVVLGVGVSHREAAGNPGRPPREELIGFLDELRARAGALPPVVVGALGPAMTRLAAGRADGVHPYLVTPEHTASVRVAVGAGVVVAPEQAVVLETDAGRARAIARAHLHPYLRLDNYRRSWLRLGFGDADLADRGSDRLVDALVAWGDDEAIAVRVRAHLDAGADHVAVQVLAGGGTDPRTDPWERIAALVPSSQS